MTRDACRDCAVGRASGEGQGQFCPFIDREYQSGDVLYREGEPAEYVWFVKSGAVELEHGPAAHGQKSVGSFVGLETLIRNRYDATARVTADATLCGATREGFADWLGPHSDRTCAILHDLLRTTDEPPPSDEEPT